MMGRKPLKGWVVGHYRTDKTIVLTRDKEYRAENVIVMHSLEEVITYDQNHEGETFIAGGSAIYTEFLPLL